MAYLLFLLPLGILNAALPVDSVVPLLLTVAPLLLTVANALGAAILSRLDAVTLVISP